MTAMLKGMFNEAGAQGAMLLDDAEEISNARTVDDVWNVLTRRLAPLGFDRLLYGLTQFRSDRSFGSPDDLMVLSSHDDAYTRQFVGDGLFFHAPMAQWTRENTGACSWGWVANRQQQLSPQELKVVEFNQKMRVCAGYTISFPSESRRAKAALSLTARPGLSQLAVDAIWAENGRWIETLARIAHLKILVLPHTSSRRPLTKRQREVLEWVGDGKTMQDIACIMGLTSATIEKHLRLAREVLDVGTTAQAVMKASLQNQIFNAEP